MKISFWTPAASWARSWATHSSTVPKIAAAFVDSLALAFQVPPPPAVGYYFTDDLIQTLGAAGLEFFPLGSDTVGGRSNALDHLVFIGSSSNGEGYRHELAHVILGPSWLRSMPRVSSKRG